MTTTLSRRELEVLTLLASGLMLVEVAEKLGISPKTVSCYLARIRHKRGIEVPPRSSYRRWIRTVTHD
jgi:DNA-binding CsgD family transcriptional regulator